MVDPNKLLVTEVRKFITHVAGLPVCDNKIKIMDKLLDLEWSLREKENTNDVPDEFEGGREAPWVG